MASSRSAITATIPTTLAAGCGTPIHLHEALGLAPQIAAAPGGLIGDLVNGTPGQGLPLLRLAGVTGDPQWLEAARRLADQMLARAVGAWLDGLAVPVDAGVNWYRREPDQREQYQGPVTG